MRESAAPTPFGDLEYGAIDVTTIGDLLLRAAARWPDRDCLVLPGARYTFGSLAQRAVERARALIGLGIQPAEHVAIFLPTSVEFFETLFGVSLAGAVPVPVNARYRGDELRYLIDNADVAAVITTNQVAESVDLLTRLREGLGDAGADGDPVLHRFPNLPKLRTIVTLSGDAPGVLGPDAFADLAQTVDSLEVHVRRSRVRARDTGIILYTSGTTSNPKGCLLSHEAIIRNGMELARRYAMTDADRFWSPMAMYHIGGIMPIAAVLQVGCRYVTMPHFEAGLALRMLEDERVTINYVAFWPLLSDLLNHADFAAADLSATRLMNSSIAMLPEASRERLATALPNTLQVSTYGLTEAAGTVSTSRLDDPYDVRTSRLGEPLRGLEVRVVDEHDREMPVGERGEIIVRGYAIIDGYYKDAVKTAAAMRGGWLHTGDIGSLDEIGHIMFHGRTKDMLKVGGENVAALEIEAFVGGHPDVKLCQVVGCPDERLVEVPAAFVELKQGAALAEADIIAYCTSKIASFKVPRFVRFVSEWPMGATKIQKFKLRDQLIVELGLEDPEARDPY